MDDVTILHTHYTDTKEDCLLVTIRTHDPDYRNVIREKTVVREFVASDSSPSDTPSHVEWGDPVHCARVLQMLRRRMVLDDLSEV